MLRRGVPYVEFGDRGDGVFLLNERRDDAGHQQLRLEAGLLHEPNLRRENRHPVLQQINQQHQQQQQQLQQQQQQLEDNDKLIADLMNGRQNEYEAGGRLAATAKNAIPAVRRLIKELQVMETEPPENTWARPKSMNNLLKWRAKIRGPDGSPYENGIFELALSFPEAYPFKAPIVRFITPLYHCNVNGLGYICVDVLDEGACWSPGLTIDKLLLSLSSMLNDADPLTAYNAEAASLFMQDRERYELTARAWTKRHAMDVSWE